MTSRLSYAGEGRDLRGSNSCAGNVNSSGPHLSPADGPLALAAWHRGRSPRGERRIQETFTRDLPQRARPSLPIGVCAPSTVLLAAQATAAHPRMRAEQYRGTPVASLSRHGWGMNALFLALLLVSQPGLLPRKPPSAQSDVKNGAVNPPEQFPNEPATPPVILDEAPKAPAAPATAQPAPAPTLPQASAAPTPAPAARATPQPAPAPTPAQPPAQAQAAPPPAAQPGAPPVLRPYPSIPGPGHAPAAPSYGTGQWIYTQRYGWVFMPRSAAYSPLPPNGYGQPYTYVYHPQHGWTRVEAPWAWGVAPWPRFGVFGPPWFGWRGSGPWPTPWRWRYVPGPYYVRPTLPPA